MRRIARENPTWGEERIVGELKLKLGIEVSARTVGKYLPQNGSEVEAPFNGWATFVRNHVSAIAAPGIFAERRRHRSMNVPPIHLEL